MFLSYVTKYFRKTSILICVMFIFEILVFEEVSVEGKWALRDYWFTVLIFVELILNFSKTNLCFL